MTVTTTAAPDMPKWLTDLATLAILLLLPGLLLPICRSQSHAQPKAIAFAVAHGLGARFWMYILIWTFTNDSLSSAASAEPEMAKIPDAGLPALGEIVHWRMEPWIIVVSFVASFVGSFTTVELLHRRTTRGGWRKWQVTAI